MHLSKLVFILFDLRITLEFSLLAFKQGFFLYFCVESVFPTSSFPKENRHLMLMKIHQYNAALKFCHAISLLTLSLDKYIVYKSICQANIFLCVSICTS